VFGVAAMLSKPSTVVLPLVLLLCEWWEQGRWQRGDLLRVTPFFGFALGMSAMTVIEQHRRVQGAGAAGWQLPLAKRLAIAGKLVWFYVAHVLWPAKLMFVYPRWDTTAGSISSWLPLAGVIAVGVLLWTCRRKPWARAGLFGMGFFVVALLPVMGFFNVYYFRYSFVADHFQYLASIGVITLGVAITARLVRERSAQVVLGLAVGVVLLALSWQHGAAFQNDRALWRDTLTKNPECWLAHNNLGVALDNQGKVTEAIAHYEQALRAEPDYAETHYNMGVALEQTGRIKQAIGQYEQALQINSDYAEAHNNLGNALAQAGRIPEAIEHLQQALRIKPDYAKAYNNLGNAFLQEGNVKEAIAHYEHAVRIESDYAQAHRNLANALFRLGETRLAMEHYEQALRVEPSNAETQNGLAWLLATLTPADGGDPIRAATLARQACDLTHNAEPNYLDTLAAAYAAEGHFSDAVVTAQKAIDLARSSGQAALVKDIEARLELYRSGRAYSPSTGVTSPSNH
jgi:tetratricopeptide (TPR) repeat protein